VSGDAAAALINTLIAVAGDEDRAIAMSRAFGFSGFVTRRLGVQDAGVKAERLALGFSGAVLREAGVEASVALSTRGVPHFVGKGVAFMPGLYQPGDRQLADLDLWVHQDAVPPAREALVSLGYTEGQGGLQSGPASLRPGSWWFRDAPSPVESVSLDLHWGVEPVTRVLPRVGLNLPEEVWECLDGRGPFPVPDPAHHAALLIHHLVHHDLLHIRGLLDLVLLWQRGLARERLVGLTQYLGVWRAARAIGTTLARELALGDAALGAPAGDWRGRRLARLVRLDRWLNWAARAQEREYVEMTPRRLVRRMILLDRARDVPRLLADVVWPPADHLRWRWPAAGTIAAARWQHARHVLKKARVA